MPKPQPRPRFQVVPLERVPTQKEKTNSTRAGRRILSISNQPALATTRELVLKRAGYEVSSAGEISEALRLCSSERFDLMIIGHGMPIEQRQTLITELRKKSDAPVLALRIAGERDLAGAENFLFGFESPESLLRTVERMLHA